MSISPKDPARPTDAFPEIHPHPHPLDDPIWSALTSQQAGVAEGESLARRYPVEIAPFGTLDLDPSLALRRFAQIRLRAQASSFRKPVVPRSSCEHLRRDSATRE